MKRCPTCQNEKPLDDFGVNNSKPDGRASYCLICMRAKRKQRWQDPAAKESQRLATLRWREKNREKFNATRRAFHAARSEADKAARREHARLRRAANPERYAEYNRRNQLRRIENGKEREYRLQADYRIGVADYDALMERQGERCPICDRSLTDGRVKPVVDHCHDSGRVRGILCNGCNMHLGWFEARQKAARAYLKNC